MAIDDRPTVSCLTDSGESTLYAEPCYVDQLEDCDFYHTIDLPGLGEIPGQWDLRGRVQDYTGRVNVAGKRVLDVGTASGYLTMSLEKQGAEVVSFDADDAKRIDFLPFKNSLYTKEREKWELETNLYLHRLRNSYWLTHRLYGLRARAYYGDVYNLPVALGQFDVVVVGQILVHLRDPIAALTSLARLCKGDLVISEDMIDSEDTIARLTSTPDGPDWLWWHYSVGTYRFLMTIMGFEVLSVTTNRYPCQHEYLSGKVKISTMVARKLP